MKSVLIACFSALLLMFASLAAAVVDLNTATETELDTLKGVGPSKAKAIVEYREKNGPFKSVDDLDNVKGFGAKTVEKLRPELTVGGSVAPAAPAAVPKVAAPKVAAPVPPAIPAAPTIPGVKTPAVPATPLTR